MKRMWTMRWWCLALVVTLAPGCGLLLDFDPPDGQNLECFVTVRNPAGLEVVVSSIAHEDFANRRRYFTCDSGPCPTTCSRRTVAEAEADWRIWTRREIERISADPASSSTFRMAAGPWCEIPGTLRCEARGFLEGTPPCDDITGPDLCTAVRPVGDPCIEVSCPGPSCTAIDFGDLPVGESLRRPVTVSNCGVVDVRTRIDDVILPIGVRGEFEIPADSFGCGERNPDEAMFGRILQPSPGDSECSFEVEFHPTLPLEHRSEKVFWSEALADHTIALSGVGIGGGLIDDAPPSLCFEEAVPCTPQQTILLTNGGPGPVIVTDVRATPGNFRVSPTPAMLDITLNVGDPPLEVLVQWCDSAGAGRSGFLGIDTSERRIVVDLETLASCP